jgi:hypothetical protein
MILVGKHELARVWHDAIYRLLAALLAILNCAAELGSGRRAWQCAPGSARLAGLEPATGCLEATGRVARTVPDLGIEPLDRSAKLGWVQDGCYSNLLQIPAPCRTWPSIR